MFPNDEEDPVFTKIDPFRNSLDLVVEVSNDAYTAILQNERLAVQEALRKVKSSTGFSYYDLARLLGVTVNDIINGATGGYLPTTEFRARFKAIFGFMP
jgi:hypothetical protein